MEHKFYAKLGYTEFQVTKKTQNTTLCHNLNTVTVMKQWETIIRNREDFLTYQMKEREKEKSIMFFYMYICTCMLSSIKDNVGK